MDTSRLMDTSSITDHLPKGGSSSIVSHLADATTGLADQITDHAGNLGSQIGDLDISAGVRRGRRLVARVVPWTPATRARDGSRRRLIVAGALVAVAVTIVLLCRRSAGERPSRDDWATTPSPNGASPSSPTDDRQTAGATA